MSSTQSLIKQYKQELQNLRNEYLRKSADPQEKARIEFMISVRKTLLEQLGAKENG